MRPSFWILVLWAMLGVSAATSTKRTVGNLSAKSVYKTLLALDGGGLRLHMTNQILIELESQIGVYLKTHPELREEDERTHAFFKEDKVYLADYFSCISGVSSGSWVALYYASKGGNGAAQKVFSRPDVIAKYGHLYPGQARGLDVFFEMFGSMIYPPPPTCSVRSPEQLSIRSFPLRNPTSAANLYPVYKLEKLLEWFYGDTKLSQLNTSVLVYAFDVVLRNPVLFVFNDEATPSYSAAIRVQSFDTIILQGEDQELLSHRGLFQHERYEETRREDFFIRDLARASSALPGVQVEKHFTALDNKTSQYTCVDGVLVTPNPTMNSLSFMLKMNTIQEIQKIATLSLGAGAVVNAYASDVQAPISWDLTENIFRVIIYGASENVQNNLHYVFYDQLKYKEGQFTRINPLTNDTSKYAKALDSVTDLDQLKMLKAIGKLVAKDYKEELRNFIEKFLFKHKKKDAEEDKT